MTRINASIPPRKLCDQHLIAEYRELPRVVTLAAKYDGKKLPEKFTLGKGHVRFFYNKLFFLHKRYDSIVAEMKARKYNVSLELIDSVDSSFLELTGSKLYNDYEPTPEAHLLLSIRLKDRFYSMDKITFYGIPVTADEAFKAISYVTKQQVN